MSYIVFEWNILIKCNHTSKRLRMYITFSERGVLKSKSVTQVTCCSIHVRPSFISLGVHDVVRVDVVWPRCRVHQSDPDGLANLRPDDRADKAQVLLLERAILDRLEGTVRVLNVHSLAEDWTLSGR